MPIARVASGDGYQGCEMAVSVAEFERLDTAAAGGHGVIEKVRCAGRECRLTIFLPRRGTAP
jgi:hypothetical protein